MGRIISVIYSNKERSFRNILGRLVCSDAGVNYLGNAVLNQSTEFTSTANPVNNWVYSLNQDNTEGNNWMFTYQATVNWQTAEKQNTVGAWKMAITGTARTTLYPVKFKIAEVAHNAGQTITVTN